MKRLCRSLLAIVATLAVLSSLTACTSEPKEYPAEGVTVFVVGNHANAPAPNISVLDAYLTKTAEESVTATDVVCADGAPAEVGTFETLGSGADNSNNQKDEISYSIKYLKDRIANVVADDAEVDLLESIRLAARLIDSYVEDNFDGDAQADTPKSIIVLDSGLSTAGLVDFTQDGMLAADGEDVASMLDGYDSLVDLEGVEVKWYFMGDVQAPQDTLSQTIIGQLKGIWQAVIEAGEGAVEFKSGVASAADDSRNDMEPDVTEVTVEAPQPIVSGKTTTVVLTDSEIKFIGYTSKYAYPDDAERVIKKWAEKMLENPKATLHITGTTATIKKDKVSQERMFALSLRRAKRVKKTFVKFGVSAERISTEGVGDQDDEHLDDLDSSGALIDAIATKNRKVILTFTGLPEE